MVVLALVIVVAGVVLVVILNTNLQPWEAPLRAPYLLPLFSRLSMPSALSVLASLSLLVLIVLIDFVLFCIIRVGLEMEGRETQEVLGWVQRIKNKFMPLPSPHPPQVFLLEVGA